MSSRSRFGRPVLLRPGIAQTLTGKQRVRNVATGRVLPCSWSDCRNDGDNRYRIEVPHSNPRWKDPLTGKQEMVVYIFCRESHKAAFAKGTGYERYT